MCVHFVADSRMHFMQLPFIWKKMSWKVLIRKCNMLFSYTGKTQSLSLFLFHNSLWMWIPWNLYNWCKYNVQSSSDIFYVLIWILSGKPDRWLLIPNLCSNTSTHLLLNLWLQILHHSGKKKHISRITGFHNSHQDHGCKFVTLLFAEEERNFRLWWVKILANLVY